MPVAHDVGVFGQRAKGGPVAPGPYGDDLPVGAVHLRTANRQPSGEGGVHLGQ